MQCNEVGLQREGRMQGEVEAWMGGWIAPFLLLYFHSLPVFVAGALVPAASGPQLSPQSVPISLALCVNVP